jgi:hypothetical protein
LFSTRARGQIASNYTTQDGVPYLNESLDNFLIFPHFYIEKITVRK